MMKSYRHSSFLAESNESISAQNFGDFELIIVDDASNDASRQILDSYAAADLQIEVIFLEYNKDISKTETEQLRETF
jgi:glycosyltransferase involved in cell wall biosynthesis